MLPDRKKQRLNWIYIIIFTLFGPYSTKSSPLQEVSSFSVQYYLLFRLRLVYVRPKEVVYGSPDSASFSANFPDCCSGDHPLLSTSLS